METLLKKEKNTGMDKAAPMIPISVVASILNVHQRTLRIYDAEKILSPSRSAKNRRLYSMDDIEKGMLIQFLTREIGLNIAAVKIIVHLLKQQKIATDKYLDFIKNTAAMVNITADIQAENKLKFGKRGRRKADESI
jgi:DNA-binding transcriptional MerR regulator